jgi:hypothetical protein
MARLHACVRCLQRRAWKDENDARLSAERASPEEFRRKVEALEAARGRTINAEDRQRFCETVRRLGIEQFSPPMVCRIEDLEATNFANQVSDLYKQLRNSDLGIGYSFDAQSEFDCEGVAFIVNDEAKLPENVRKATEGIYCGSAFGTFS